MDNLDTNFGLASATVEWHGTAFPPFNGLHIMDIEESTATFWNLAATIKWVRDRDPADERLPELYLDMRHLGKIAGSDRIRRQAQAFVAAYREHLAEIISA